MISEVNSNVSIAHSSGIIGPGGLLHHNRMIRTIQDMASGKIPAGVEGGYDFIDVRDVVKGIPGCERKGRKGECYIRNGHYIAIPDLLNMVRKIAGKSQIKSLFHIAL